MIRISFNGSDKRVIAFLRSRSEQLIARLTVTMDELMTDLQARIQQKLSGEVLQQRSGKLLRSIHKEPTTIVARKIVGSVTGAGGPAFYGRIHETGGTRAYEIVPVNKKALAFFPAGALGISGGQSPGRGTSSGLYFKMGMRRGTLRPQGYAGFGQLGGIVRKKVIHPPLPARPFMETSLAELTDRIISQVKQAAVAALKE